MGPLLCAVRSARPLPHPLCSVGSRSLGVEVGGHVGGNETKQGLILPRPVGDTSFYPTGRGTGTTVHGMGRQYKRHGDGVRD